VCQFARKIALAMEPVSMELAAAIWTGLAKTVRRRADAWVQVTKRMSHALATALASTKHAFVTVFGLAQTVLCRHALLIVRRKGSVSTARALVSLDGQGHHVHRWVVPKIAQGMVRVQPLCGRVLNVPVTRAGKDWIVPFKCVHRSTPMYLAMLAGLVQIVRSWLIVPLAVNENVASVFAWKASPDPIARSIFVLIAEYTTHYFLETCQRHQYAQNEEFVQRTMAVFASRDGLIKTAWREQFVLKIVLDTAHVLEAEIVMVNVLAWHMNLLERPSVLHYTLVRIALWNDVLATSMGYKDRNVQAEVLAKETTSSPVLVFGIQQPTSHIWAMPAPDRLNSFCKR
jgi:hypothetical protein